MPSRPASFCLKVLIHLFDQIWSVDFLASQWVSPITPEKLNLVPLPPFGDLKTKSSIQGERLVYREKEPQVSQ